MGRYPLFVYRSKILLPTMIPEPKLRLLIIDDHAVVREGLEAMLGVEPCFESIATAASTEEALPVCDSFRPQVVLLDLRMPGSDGFNALEIIHRRWPETRVLILSASATAAEVKLAPVPIPPSAAMITVPVFSNHNAIVRAQRAQQLKAHPLGALVAGHQKDVVISAKLASAPGKVAIYGWHQTNGVPIQPLYLKHIASWVDYSQCVRLVQQNMLVNGVTKTVAGILADPALAGLLSDEGAVPNPRYPTNALPPSPPKSAPRAGHGAEATRCSGIWRRISSSRTRPMPSSRDSPPWMAGCNSS